MKYTVRFAHLSDNPKLKVGDKIKRGDIIGVMGTSGQSTAPHLHIDCIVGIHSRPYKLSDIGTRFAPDQKQLTLFIDDELFGIKPIITTAFLDQAYKKLFGKDHPAYDVVPKDRLSTKDHFSIHWNRSKVGNVEIVVYQPESYGHCVYVSFEA